MFDEWGIILTKVKKNKLVVTQANELARAHQVMSLQEKRLLLLLISKIRKEDVDFTTYRFSIAEIKRLLGLERDKDFYKRIDSISSKLLSRVVKMVDSRDPESWLKFQWVSKAKLVKKNSPDNALGQTYLELQLHNEMKPLVLELRDHFSQIPFSQLIEISSYNSVRLFEILHADSLGLKRKKVVYELDDLKARLGLIDKYKNFANFNKRVLSLAQREIGKSTNVNLEYKTIKSGRKVTGIEFILYEKKAGSSKKILSPSLKPKKTSKEIEVNKEPSKLEKELIAAGWRGGADKIIKKYGAELVEETLKLAKERQAQLINSDKAIKNLGGLINKLLNEGAAKEVLELKQRKEQKKQLKEFVEKLKEEYYQQRKDFLEETWAGLSKGRQKEIFAEVKAKANHFELDQLEKHKEKSVIFDSKKQKLMEESGELNYPNNLKNIEDFVFNYRTVAEFTSETKNKIKEILNQN